MSNISALLKGFSTPLISDVLDKMGINGGLQGILPLKEHYDIAGPIFTVIYEPVREGESAPAGDYIDDVAANSVILISNQGYKDCTVWGDILSFVAQKRNIAGTVIDGACRDIKAIIELDYPVFSKYKYMKSGKNRTAIRAIQKKVTIAGQDIYPGDYIRADASGVIIIPQDVISEVIQHCHILQKIESKIIEELTNGLNLKAAREKYNYNHFSYNKVEA